MVKTEGEQDKRMSTSKPVDELTIKDLREHPIWEWVLDEEHGEQDETWVKPSKTKNFTEELNGSLVLGELITLRDEIFPVMCSLSIEDSDVSISSAIFYDDKQNEYYAVEDMVKSIAFPLRFLIHLTINGEPRALKFTANKVDVYKNDIKMNVCERY